MLNDAQAKKYRQEFCKDLLDWNGNFLPFYPRLCDDVEKYRAKVNLASERRPLVPTLRRWVSTLDEVDMYEKRPIVCLTSEQVLERIVMFADAIIATREKSCGYISKEATIVAIIENLEKDLINFPLPQVEHLPDGSYCVTQTYPFLRVGE